MAADEENTEELVRTLDLAWSDTEYDLCDFLDKFPLPQLVQVASGNYNASEEETLLPGQTLILHKMQKRLLYKCRVYNGKEVFIPLNCQAKVEIRPQSLSLIYDTVTELCTVFPGSVHYVRVTRNHFDILGPERSCRKGMKLKLEFISRDDPDEPLLICIDENGCEIALAMSVQGGFQPLGENGDEYQLCEIRQNFGLPLYVQFVSTPNPIDRQKFTKHHNKPPTMINVIKTVEEHTVIASTRLNGVKTILAFSRDLDVSLVTPQRINDSSFTHISQSLNNEIDLVKLSNTYLQIDEVYDSQVVRQLPFTATDIEQDEHLYIDIDDNQNIHIRSRSKKIKQQSESSKGCRACYLVQLIRRYRRKKRQQKPALPSRDYVEKTDDNTTQAIGRSNIVVSTTIEEEEDLTDNAEGDYIYPDKMKKKGRESPKYEDMKENENDNVEYIDPNEGKETGESSIYHDPANVIKEDSDEEEYLNPDVVRAIEDKNRNTQEDSDTTADKENTQTIEGMSDTEVAELLKSIGLGKYCEKFQNDQIDGNMLKDLDQAMLEEHFEMNSYEAHKLIMAISKNWRPKKE